MLIDKDAGVDDGRRRRRDDGGEGDGAVLGRGRPERVGDVIGEFDDERLGGWGG
jgi:hypothetical protein